MKRLLLLAAALIVYGSLFPWHFDWQRAPQGPFDILLNSWPDTVDRFLLRDVLLNVLLYMPLGLAAFLSFWPHRSRALAFTAASLTGFGLSTAMEILQVYVPGRQPSLLDITTNTIGTVAGALGGLLFFAQIELLLQRRSRRRPAAAAFLLAAWVACQLYPFFPQISHYKLYAAAAALAHGFPLSAVELWASAAEWFAAALALRSLLDRLPLAGLAAAMGVLGIRMFVATRVVTLNELAGAAIALLLWFVIRDGMRVRAALWFLALALFLRELAPFQFMAQAAPFTWIPFLPTLESARESAVVILARKAFDYGAMVWLLRQARVRYSIAAGAVAAALFVCEQAQRHLAGRTPEITDAALTLLMGLVLWRLDISNLSASPRRSSPVPGV